MSKPSKKEPRLSMFAGGVQLARLARTEPSSTPSAPGAAPKRARAKAVAGPAVRARVGAVDEERLDARLRDRLVDEVEGALKRKPLSEVKLAGVVRVLGPLSASLRTELFRAADVLVRRAVLGRELWGAIVRTLAEADHPGLESLLAPALALEEGGGSATLSAAGFCSSKALVAQLAKLASGGKPYVAFAAEIARVVRGDSPGTHLLHLAPIIKEAHRVGLATQVVAPLVRGLAGASDVGGAAWLPLARPGERLGPGFEVLRSAERHLGRWLLFAEAVVLGGDDRPLVEAREKSVSGADSSRGAWALVAWALAHARSRRNGEAPPASPTLRPTTELSARLSDRPSADRDLSFLFRLASAAAPSAKPMLDALVRGPIEDEARARAASHLARSFGRTDLFVPLAVVARSSAREDLRGLGIAALHDAGDTATAKALAEEALAGKHLGNAAWAARVLATNVGGFAVSEGAVRHLQWGVVE